MKRRLLTILSALSLVLCLASGGMWVRSGFVWDSIHKDYGRGPSYASLRSFGGDLLLEVESVTSPLPDSPHGGSWSVYVSVVPGRRLPAWGWQWPHYWTSTGGRLVSHAKALPVATRDLLLPYWLLTLSTALLPGSRWTVCFCRRWKAKQRYRLGLCATCGYDLRACAKRCPECGTAVPARSPTPSSSDPA